MEHLPPPRMVAQTEGGFQAMSTSSRTPLPDEDKRGVRALYEALEPFREIRGDMPLQYVTTFLLIAMDEGKSVGEYAERAGVSKSVMSRHILDLGDRTRYMEAGLGLMYSRANPNELRKHEVYLTPVGRALAKKVLRLWQLAGER